MRRIFIAAALSVFAAQLHAALPPEIDAVLLEMESAREKMGAVSYEFLIADSDAGERITLIANAATSANAMRTDFHLLRQGAPKHPLASTRLSASRGDGKVAWHRQFSWDLSQGGDIAPEAHVFAATELNTTSAAGLLPDMEKFPLDPAAAAFGDAFGIPGRDLRTVLEELSAKNFTLQMETLPADEETTSTRLLIKATMPPRGAQVAAFVLHPIGEGYGVTSATWSPDGWPLEEVTASFAANATFPETITRQRFAPTSSTGQSVLTSRTHITISNAQPTKLSPENTGLRGIRLADGDSVFTHESNNTQTLIYHCGELRAD